MSQIKLIIGLGNPGAKYTKTRHNAGFWFVEALAERYHAGFLSESRFSGDVCKLDGMTGDINSPVWLLKPMTFMNRSGQSAQQLASYFKIAAHEILVVHDELDLPAGTIRLKSGGGHGGHNGLRDLHAHIGKDYWRLRIGIGHPGDRNKVVDYVLSNVGKEDEIEIHNAMERALNLVGAIVSGDTQKVMNQLHSEN